MTANHCLVIRAARLSLEDVHFPTLEFKDILSLSPTPALLAGCFFSLFPLNFFLLYPVVLQ
jgi:hypothetical protein